jgi:peptide/nickel transport system permease protein
MGLLSGAAVVESVFNIPGVGQLVVNSVTRRDYEVIQIVVLLTALINVLVCLIIDILYGLFDPRVKVGR